MPSPRLPPPLPLSNTRRRFLLSYGVGVLVCLAVFLAVSAFIDSRTRERQESIFSRQQAQLVRLARQSTQAHMESLLHAATIVANHSLPEFVRGTRDDESVFRLFNTAKSRIPTLLSVAFLETPVYFSAHASHYQGKGNMAQQQALGWAREHWDVLAAQASGFLIPPLRIAPDLSIMGILFPIHVDGAFRGVFAIAADLSVVIDRFIGPLPGEDHAQSMLLDGDGTILYADDGRGEGRTVLGPREPGRFDAIAMDPRMLTQPAGTGSYMLTTRKGGALERRLLAWDSLEIGGRRLIIASTAPAIEVDAVLEGLRLERLAVGLLLFCALLVAGVHAYRRTALYDLATAQRQVADIIEFLPDATFAVDNQGRVIAWNRAIAAMTGVPREEMLGKGDMQYAEPFYGHPRKGLIDLMLEGADDLERFYTNVEREGSTLNAETYVPEVYGGRGAHVWATASVLRDEDGNRVGAIESIRDITERIAAEEALRASENRYALAIAGANDGIWDWDLVTDAVYFSPRWKEIIGYADHELDNEVSIWRDRIHPDDWDTIMSANKAVADGRTDSFSVEYRLRHRDGTYRWILGRGAGLRDDSGATIRMSGAHTDITDRKDNETVSNILLDISSAVSTTRDLPALYEAVHAILLRHIGAENFFIALVDEERDRIDFAYACDPDHGLPWEPVPICDLDGRSLTLHVYRTGKPSLFDREQQIERGVLGEPAEVWCGVPLRMGDKIIGVMAVQDYADPHRYTRKDLALLTSVSEQVALAIERRMHEEQIHHQALHDSLTGLPNRDLFMDRLERAMRRGRRRENYHFAVLMMDLDRFKMVNDSHGHMVGDMLLKEAAARLHPVMRQDDTLARLGGDEFAVLLEDVDTPRQVIQVVQRIQAALAEPMDLDGREVRTSASVGIVLRTENYDSSEAVLRDSDIAMYQAKRQGKGLFRVFNSAMHEQAVLAMALENDMAQALEAGDFHLYFQPIFKTGTLRLAGFEALLRWDHAVRGAVPPAEFIPVAEETGLILPIGEWVLGEACAVMADWRERHPDCEDVFLSVNLSVKQAAQTTMVRQVRRVLAETALPPKMLKLELTETAVMQDPVASLERFKRLKRLGVGLAIDDFGTGHSSLAYLSRFPVDTLKVDNTFVRGLAEQPDNMEIIRTIVALAEPLGLDVVAEGVEDARQLETVRVLGCGSVQGFHLGRPMPPHEAEGLLAACAPAES